MNLNQITVPSLDLEASVPFYKLLGLQLIVHAPPHYARFVCPDGDSSFSISKVEELPSGHGIHIYFECDPLDQQVRALQDKGVEFDLEPTDQPWNWREARLTDPDNNQIILYSAGENRLNPPWRIKEDN